MMTLFRHEQFYISAKFAAQMMATKKLPSVGGCIMHQLAHYSFAGALWNIT
jgi:hypothetical protein